MASKYNSNAMKRKHFKILNIVIIFSEMLPSACAQWIFNYSANSNPQSVLWAERDIFSNNFW